MPKNRIKTPTIAEKWTAISEGLVRDGFSEINISDMEVEFYNGIRTYLEMLKEVRALGLSSPEEDRIIYAWEMEIYRYTIV